MSTLKRRIATVELATGEVLTVRIIHPDVLRYQETAQRHGWPSVTVKEKVGTTPHLDYEDTFCAWAALKRTGAYSGKWEEFKDATASSSPSSSRPWTLFSSRTGWADAGSRRRLWPRACPCHRTRPALADRARHRRGPRDGPRDPRNRSSLSERGGG